MKTNWKKWSAFKLPDGGTGELDCGKGLARSEVSIGSSRRLSDSETCLDEDDPLGVDILWRLFDYLKRFSCVFLISKMSFCTLQSVFLL